MMDKRDLEMRFRYRKPIPETIGKFEMLRAKALEFALMVNELCPEGRSKSLALTKLEEAVMWANASVARDSQQGTSGAVGIPFATKENKND